MRGAPAAAAPAGLGAEGFEGVAHDALQNGLLGLRGGRGTRRTARVGAQLSQSCQ
jgi:hypothetical protein